MKLYISYEVFFFSYIDTHPRRKQTGISESVAAATTQIPKVGNLIKRRGSFGSKGSRA